MALIEILGNFSIKLRRSARYPLPLLKTILSMWDGRRGGGGYGGGKRVGVKLTVIFNISDLYPEKRLPFVSILRASFFKNIFKYSLNSVLK